MEKKLVVINFLGGAGSGKSVARALTYGVLGIKGVNIEEAPEFAKELSYLESYKHLQIQPHVTFTQFMRQTCSRHAVDVVITDSPLLLGTIYRGFGCTPLFDQYVLEVFDLFDNINIFLDRDPSQPYKKIGRNQNHNEALAKDRELRVFMDKHGLEYHVVKAKNNYQTIRDSLAIIEPILQSRGVMEAPEAPKRWELFGSMAPWEAPVPDDLETLR